MLSGQLSPAQLLMATKICLRRPILFAMSLVLIKTDSNFESRIAESLLGAIKISGFIKTKKWAHESEYRIILFSKKTNIPLFRFKKA